MVTIFAETLSKILKPKFVMVYMLVISLGAAASALTVKFLFGSSILQGQIITFTSLFVVFCFFWILGLPHVGWIIYHGTGLIAGERNEGTLLLLFSKPLTRNEIFLGKYLALLFSSLLLGESSIFLSLAVMTVAAFPDDVIALYLLKLTPYLSLYLFFLTVCISTLSAGLSVFCTSRKKLLFGPAIIVTIIYIILPVLKYQLEFGLQSKLMFLSYLDPHFHLNSIFYYLVTLSESIMLSPDLLFKTAAYPFAVSPIILLIAWLFLCFFIMILAFKRLNNMDITG